MLTPEGLWTFVSGPATLAALLATALLAGPAGVRLARRRGCAPVAAVLFLAAVGVILALTLTPNRPAPGVAALPPPPHFLTQLGDPRLVWSVLTAAPSDTEQVANIALYIPAGLLGCLVWRGPVRATLVGLVLTVAIETCQYGIIGRAGSLTDIRNNAAGALLGAVAAALVVGAAGRSRRRDGHTAEHRKRAVRPQS